MVGESEGNVRGEEAGGNRFVCGEDEGVSADDLMAEPGEAARRSDQEVAFEKGARFGDVGTGGAELLTVREDLRCGVWEAGQLDVAFEGEQAVAGGGDIAVELEDARALVSETGGERGGDKQQQQWPGTP